MRKLVRFAVSLTLVSVFVSFLAGFAARCGLLKLAETYAQGGGCSATQIEVFPSNPTTNDNVTIRLSGQWPNA
jgi:hypothetical protein